MKYPHLLLAILVTAIWGVNFSVIKLGLHTIDPFILAAIRFTLSALPALFFIKKPDVPWRYLIGYGLIFGIGLWGLVNLGIKTGLSAGIASLALQFSAFFYLIAGQPDIPGAPQSLSNHRFCYRLCGFTEHCFCNGWLGYTERYAAGHGRCACLERRQHHY